jgi:undecaprenyl diphosphate synthase
LQDGALNYTSGDFYLRQLTEGGVALLAGCIRDEFGTQASGRIVSGPWRDEGDRPAVNVSIGYGGKHELTNALREIMRKVKSGEMKPEDIDEATVESHLIFRTEPDLFIRTGEERLSDFLIWQAAYSELYFTDVSRRTSAR